MAAVPARPSPHRTWTTGARSVAALSLLAAGAVHAMQVLPHTTEWIAAGAFFIAIAASQIFVGVALLTSAARLYRRLALLVSAGPFAIWVVSRTIGLPIGPKAAHVEPIGGPDLLASAFEIAAISALMVGSLALRRPTRSALVAATVASILVVAGIAASLPEHRHGGDAVPVSRITDPVDYLRAHADHAGHQPVIPRGTRAGPRCRAPGSRS